MQFSDAWSIVRRWWLVIVLCAAIGAAASTWRSADQESSYASYSQVFVTGDAPTVKDSVAARAAATDRGASYSALLAGPELARKVIDRLDLDLTPAELVARIKPSISVNGVVLAFSVSDPDKEKAEELSAAVAEEFCTLIEDLETPADGSSTVIVARPVGAPGEATLVTSAITGSRSVGLGALVGGLVGFGLAVLLQRRRAGAGVRGDADQAQSPS